MAGGRHEYTRDKTSMVNYFFFFFFKHGEPSMVEPGWCILECSLYNSWKKAQELWKKPFTHTANKHSKKCSVSLDIIKMQIKTTTRHHCIPTRMVKIKKTNFAKRWWGCGPARTLIHFGGCKMYSHVWKRSAAF